MGTAGKAKDMKNSTGKLLESRKKADGTYEFVLRENNPYESLSLDEYLKMLFEACPTTDGDEDDEAESITEEEKDQLLAQLQSRFSAADLAESSEDEENGDVETTVEDDGDSETEKEQLLTQSEGRSSDTDFDFAESNEQPCSFHSFPGKNGSVEVTCITLDDDDDNDTGSFDNEYRRLSKVQVCECEYLSLSLGELLLTSDVDDDEEVEVQVISELPPPASNEPDIQVERVIPLFDLTKNEEDVEIVDDNEYIKTFENEINVVNGS